MDPSSTAQTSAMLKQLIKKRTAIIRDIHVQHDIPVMPADNTPIEEMFIDPAVYKNMKAIDVHILGDFRRVKAEELLVFPGFSAQTMYVQKILADIYRRGGSTFDDYESGDFQSISTRILASNTAENGIPDALHESFFTLQSTYLFGSALMSHKLPKILQSMQERKKDLDKFMQSTGLGPEDIAHLSTPIPRGFIKNSIIQTAMKNALKIETLGDFRLISPDELRHAIDTIDGTVRGQIQKAVTSSGGWFFKDFEDPDHIRAIVRKFKKQEQEAPENNAPEKRAVEPVVDRQKPAATIETAATQNETTTATTPVETQAEVTPPVPVKVLSRAEELANLEKSLGIDGNNKPAYFSTAISSFKLPDNIVKTLTGNKIFTIGTFRNHTEDELLEMSGIYKKTIAEIKEILEPYGLIFFNDFINTSKVKGQIKKGLYTIVSGKPSANHSPLRQQPQAIEETQEIPQAHHQEAAPKNKIVDYDEHYGFVNGATPEYFSIELHKFNLSSSMVQRLEKARIRTMGDLRRYSENYLQTLPYMREETVKEFTEKLRPFGLIYKTDLENEAYIHEQIKKGNEALALKSHSKRPYNRTKPSNSVAGHTNSYWDAIDNLAREVGLSTGQLFTKAGISSTIACPSGRVNKKGEPTKLSQGSLQKLLTAAGRDPETPFETLVPALGNTEPSAIPQKQQPVQETSLQVATAPAPAPAPVTTPAILQEPAILSRDEQIAIYQNKFGIQGDRMPKYLLTPLDQHEFIPGLLHKHNIEFSKLLDLTKVTCLEFEDRLQKAGINDHAIDAAFKYFDEQGTWFFDDYRIPERVQNQIFKGKVEHNLDEVSFLPPSITEEDVNDCLKEIISNKRDILLCSTDEAGKLDGIKKNSPIASLSNKVTLIGHFSEMNDEQLAVVAEDEQQFKQLKSELTALGVYDIRAQAMDMVKKRHIEAAQDSFLKKYGL